MTGFMVEQAVRNYAFDMKRNHVHDEYEIYYMMNGERFYFIKDRTYHVQKGDLVLIDQHELHKTTQAGDAYHERILIQFHPTFVSGLGPEPQELDIFEVFGDNPVFRLDVKQQARVEALLHHMLTEWRQKQPGRDAYARLLLTELLIYIARQNREREQANAAYPDSRHRQISEIVRHINTHYKERLTLDQLSQQFHISRSYLSRLFKEVTGFGLNEFINQVRIKEAQRLLRTTRKTVTEVAEQTGYDNITHFGRVFRNMSGMSPSEYRKSLAKTGESSSVLNSNQNVT